MLFLTDDEDEGANFLTTFAAAEPCTVVALDEALKVKPQFSAIACLASLDADASTRVRAALSHHRTDPRMPVLFLMRDTSLYASAQAAALGATELLPCDAPPDQLVATVRRIIDSAPKASPAKAESTIEADVGEVGASLVAMLEAARDRKPIPFKVVERGAEQLLVSVRRSGIRQWLDYVRRYDDLTYQHCLLVAGIVAGFSMRLGVAPASQRLLAQAALVHDVGKAAIPRAVLHKSGGLTPAELALIRTHPAEGHALLAKQRGVDPRILAVVRHHHEFLDGTGYPDRLRHGAIPDFVRLVTICDIYAALVERRAYKAPLPPRQAFHILAEMGGKLDASLVRAFAKYVEEM